jgi:hypothetical protein
MVKTKWPQNHLKAGQILQDKTKKSGSIKLDRFGMKKIFFMTLFFKKRSSLMES